MKRIARVIFLTSCASFFLAGCSTYSPMQGSARPKAASADRAPDGISQAAIDTIAPVVPGRTQFVRGTLRPYTALGKTYYPMQTLTPVTERGIATWYGTKYAGSRTSSGEVYEPLRITAAHTVFPLPCFARVTNLENGQSLIVRVNDRGPFKEGRIIDLSYAAARKLGFAEKGSALVQVDLLTNADF